MQSVSIPTSLNERFSMSINDPRLKSAAHEFEASLMQEFLKPLQHDSLFSPDESDSSVTEDADADGDSSQGSAGALMSFGSEAMAKAISERGGFGIATKILEHFRAQSNPPVTANSSKV